MSRAPLHYHRLLAMLLAAACLLSAGCSRETAPASANTAVPAKKSVPPKQVTLAKATLQPWQRTVAIQGSLLADEDSVIGSKLACRVDSVAVDLGSFVKKGDTLVILDRSELDLRVKFAEAQLKQACAAIGLTPDGDETEVQYANSPRVELEQALIDEAQAAVTRGQQLLPTRAITGAEYDTLVAVLKAAQARYDSAINAVAEQISLIGVRRTELALAEQQLVDATILAPFDGIVESRRISPGEYVQVGQPVISLVRTDRLRLTAGVPESKARSIKTGQKVQIRVAGRDELVDAVVSRVSPTVMQTSRSVRIEADVPNPDLELQAGLFAQADIIVDADEQALAVPATAVSRFAGVQKVWLVNDGTARQQTVRTGREADDRVEILEGLAAGDQVVAIASEGHDGPVIAVDKPPAERLQVKNNEQPDQAEL